MLRELYAGRVRWDLLAPFPEQEPAERVAGDRAVEVVTGLLRRCVDPDEVDATGTLPDGLLAELRDAGLLGLMIEPELGGLGLSWLDACRVVEVAARWSMPVAYVLSIHNGFGSGSYLQVLPEGPLRELITERVRTGIVSGAADAEVAGAANDTRTTTAISVDDGYLLTGEKLFIGNGAVADFLDVSATVAGTDTVRLFFVDTASPGFEVVHTQEFMGLRGAPFGVLRLRDVHVPAEHVMPESDDWRMRPGTGGADGMNLSRLAVLARHLVIGPPSLAVARSALGWAKDFVARRTIDGRPLGEYEEPLRTTGELASEVFAIESVQQWCLLGGADTVPDLTAAKNLTSRAAWRAIDATTSLLGGEGYETARSKARRGAAPLPVERCLRDARSLRVAGGVDVMLDRWSAQANLAAAAEAPVVEAPVTEAADGHRGWLQAEAARFAETCRAVPADERVVRQRTTALLGRIGGELLGVAVVLARADGAPAFTDLADAACESARRRVGGLWSELAAEPAAATARVGERELAGAASSDLTAAVTALWCEVFKVPDIGPDDDFFSLGGHSMIAVRMAARLRDELGLRVPVRLILEHPTVADLTNRLAETAP